jgi:hypothetical protein
VTTYTEFTSMEYGQAGGSFENEKKKKKASPISNTKDNRFGDMFFMWLWNNGGLMLIGESQSTEKKPWVSLLYTTNPTWFSPILTAKWLIGSDERQSPVELVNWLSIS